MILVNCNHASFNLKYFIETYIIREIDCMIFNLTKQRGTKDIIKRDIMENNILKKMVFLLNPIASSQLYQVGYDYYY